MTLAALSPLFTWWPLFFALLAVVSKVVCPAIVRRQEQPWPPPVVYANWPPPVTPRTGGIVRSEPLVGEGSFSCCRIGGPWMQ